MTDAQKAHYDLCIANGCSPALAEALATRSFPGTRGLDRTFMQGRRLDGAQFGDRGRPAAVGRYYKHLARQAGVNTAGKYYLGTLARFPGDPRAWVSGRDDVERVCRSEGWACEGAVQVDAPKYADGYVPPDKYRVDPALVEAEVDELVAAEPHLAPKRAELAEELAEVRSGLKGQ